MSLKVGDNVRYLNATGGGTVTRISGDMAYVDEDGFETPVLVRECVVVDSPKSFTPPSYGMAARKAQATPTKESPKKTANAPTQLPIVETSGGDVLNMVLGFECIDLQAISRADYDTYLVNDSNYYVYLTLSSRDNASQAWKLRYAGLIEPNIQEFLFTLEKAELAVFDRLRLQAVAYKKDKDFEVKAPVDVEFKIDATRFVKLHCFRPNPYFDVPVIAFDIVTDDRSHGSVNIDTKLIEAAMHAAPKTADRPAKASASKKAADTDLLEVDLHASALFDNLTGMSNADILNSQIDKFTEVMLANLRNIGRRIIFIHGKGDGVLRQALLKELNHRFKGHDVQDASFREYGFGATQVTIRHTDNSASPKGKKANRR